MSVSFCSKKRRAEKVTASKKTVSVVLTVRIGDRLLSLRIGVEGCNSPVREEIKSAVDSISVRRNTRAEGSRAAVTIGIDLITGGKSQKTRRAAQLQVWLFW